MTPQPAGSGKSFGREEGRSVFGRAAASYAAARPGYPDRVSELLRDRCGLGSGTDVLEIGPGTGLATARLLASGARVTAVEPSAELVAHLRAHLGSPPGLTLIEGAFEETELPTSSFDLVVSATAFHWLDPEIALPKIAAILYPDAWLSIWWNVFGDPDEPDAFHDATEPVLGHLPPGPSSGSGGMRYALDAAARTAELAGHGFRDVEHEVLHWTLELDPARTRALYASFSNVARVPDAERERLLDAIERIAAVDFGGRVERRMLTPVYTARR